MRVLIATDGSTDASTAMNTAGRLLRKGKLHVDVLSVSPEPVLAGCASVVEDARTQLVRQGIKAHMLMDIGPPADDILKLATSYDLVVVGAHGEAERTQPGLGPVSSRIVDEASRNVLVGRELSNEAPFRVLVALDGSECAFEALRSLNKYFDISLFDVTLMHVIETSWTRLEDVDEAELTDYEKEFQQELRLFGDKVVDRGQRLLDAWGVPGTVVIQEGDPALELSSHAEEGNYDLIVAGATGRSDVKHALLGSVSLKLAWNAPCSVLVIREDR